MTDLSPLTLQIAKHLATQRKLAKLLAPLDGQRPTEWNKVDPLHSVRFEPMSMCPTCSDGILAIRTNCAAWDPADSTTRFDVYTHEERIHLCAEIALQINGLSNSYTIGSLQDIAELPDLLRGVADQVDKQIKFQSLPDDQVKTLIRVERNGTSSSIMVNGNVFPYLVDADSVHVDVSTNDVPGVTVRLLADKVEVSDTWRPESPVPA